MKIQAEDRVDKSSRRVRNKQTGQVIKQHKRWNGVEYVFLPINEFWEEIKPCI